MMHEQPSLNAATKLVAVAVVSALTSSCASLAHEKTNQLCAAERHDRTHCLVSHNATILQAEQDYADYAERFNALAANLAVRREYQALRAKAGGPGAASLAWVQPQNPQAGGQRLKCWPEHCDAIAARSFPAPDRGRRAR